MESRAVSRQITEGVIWKQILLFFFPILLGTFFQQMYNTVDTIIVGRFCKLGVGGVFAPQAPCLPYREGGTAFGRDG